MERHCKLVYNKDVLKKDLPKISKPNQVRIHRAINTKLQLRPELFGKPLRQSLKGYRSMRVGDYRIVYQISNKIIKVEAIQKRAIAYKKILIQIQP